MSDARCSQVLAMKLPISALLAPAVAVLLVLALLIFLLSTDAPPQQKTTALPARHSVTIPAPTSGAQSYRLAPTAAAEAAADAVCGLETIHITGTGAAHRSIGECVSAVRSSQNGIVRSHRFSGGRDLNWFLYVETNGGAISRIETGHGGTAAFQCRDAHCQGVTLGRPDFNGVQRITLRQTLLARVIPSARPDDADTLVIDATLTSGALTVACPSASVTMNFSDNSYGTFCALGGIGSELRDDGHWLHRFRDLDGETLTLTVTADNRILAIDFDDGRYRCENTACGGASITPEDAAGGRDIRFWGAVLRGQAADGRAETVALNGGLQMKAYR
jgi:hypothetical protein